MSTPMVRVNRNALRRQFAIKELDEKQIATDMGKSPNYFISALAESKMRDGASMIPFSMVKLMEKMYSIPPESYILAENNKEDKEEATVQPAVLDYEALSKAIKDGIVEAFKELDFKELVKAGLIEALNYDSKRGEECHV